MKTTPKIIIISAALLAVGAATNVVQHFEMPMAKVTVKVVDEHGASLENANVKLVFGNVTVKGATDVNGLFTGEGRCGLGDMGSTITKDGYYLGAVPLPNRDDYTYNEALNRWEPWNATYVAILRPIVNPVALYAKVVQTSVPALDKPCGYDLEAGDWVTPYGKGFKSDFIFTTHRDFKDWFNFKVEAAMTFTQPDDGLLAMTSPVIASNSIFLWERLASESGYTNAHNIYFINHDPRGGQKQEKNFDITKRDSGYFFRVRSVKQGGQIVSAHYGKITGDIAIDARDSQTCMVMFTYYFNPNPLDRNLEWDTTKNLFSGLGWEQNPREP